MTETPKQDAPAYDNRGNVRPTDARFTGADRPKVSAQELVDIRAAEIRRNTEILAERQAKLQAENDQRLREATEGVLPSSQLDAAADVDEPAVPPADPAQVSEPYAGLTYAELQSTAKSRELNAGGTADEILARLLEDDASKAGA